MEQTSASSRVGWSTAGRTRLLTVDYSGLDGATMLGVLDEAVAASLAVDEPFALLVDVTGAAMTSEWLLAIKKHSRDVWAPRVTRCAVLGVGGMKAAMLRGFNAVGGGMRAVPVGSKERAVAWLDGDTH